MANNRELWRIIDLIQAHYRWTDDVVMALPLKRLFMLSQTIDDLDS